MNSKWRSVCCLLGGLAGWIVGWLGGPRCAWGDDDPGQAFCGARARVVWVQDQSADQRDVLALGKQLQLWGYDTADGQGERVISRSLRNYSKPLLTADGERVVYSDVMTHRFWVVDFTGEQRRNLGAGFALEVWRDPQTQIDWVYFAQRISKPGDGVYRNVRRMQLDHPQTTEPVWNTTNVSCDNFQLSADGTKVAGEFPWPNGGTADLVQKTWKKLEQGCWSSLAPDNSGLSWVFDGPHRHVVLHRPDQPAGWKVAVNLVPDGQSVEMFHPRWSNHVRFFALTGPYRHQGPANLVSGGGPQAEIWVGRFQPDFQQVEELWQVTHNDRADLYPDAWISGGAQSRVDLPGLAPGAAVAQVTWPPFEDECLWSWQNSREPPLQRSKSDSPTAGPPPEPHGWALWNPRSQAWLNGGELRFRDVDPVVKLTETQTKIWSWTATLELGTKTPAPALIVQVLDKQGQPTLQLWQRGETLTCRSADGSAATFPCAVAASSQAWVFSLTRSGKGLAKWSAWCAGAEVTEVSAPAGNAPAATVRPEHATSELILGSADFRGQVSQLAWWSRELTTAEILGLARLNARDNQQHPAPAEVRIRARCVEVTQLPDPARLLPYRRALVVHRYQVEQVLAGDCPHQEILVAHWALLDGRPLPEIPGRLNQVSDLRLQALADHPELDGERQVSDTDQFDLPTYYDISFARVD